MHTRNMETTDWKQKIRDYQAAQDEQRLRVDQSVVEARSFIENVARPALLEVVGIIVEGGTRMAQVEPVKVGSDGTSSPARISVALCLGGQQDLFEIIGQVMGEEIQVFVRNTDRMDDEPKLMGNADQVDATMIQEKFTSWYLRQPRLYLTNSSVA